VDRVDGYVKDDKHFLRVVDYKTGEKPFDLTDIWQVWASRCPLPVHPRREGQRALPAGNHSGRRALPSRADFIVRGGRDMTQEELRRSADRELRRKGLVLDDPDSLARWNPRRRRIRFLPSISAKKTGRISGEALVSAAQLGKLHRHVNTPFWGISAANWAREHSARTLV
jgi:ATP-dependent helicase/nuclease subunit B